MTKMNIKNAKNIVKELIDMVVGRSEWTHFYYDDINNIEIATNCERVVVGLDYDKGLVASVYTRSGKFWRGLVSKIDDGLWLKMVWEDVNFNKGEKSIPNFKNVKKVGCLGL